MQSAPADSSFKYSVFTFAVDDAGAIEVPIGVALWSDMQQAWNMRTIDAQERLERFRVAEHFPFVDLVNEKIQHWARTEQLPYATEPLQPYQTGWWNHLRNLLVHRVRLSEPHPIDCKNPQEELGALYESVISPYRSVREQRTRVGGEIKRCLNGLSRKFKPRREYVGYKGRKVRVLRAFDGPRGSVIIEGVNLATVQAELHSDATVSKLLRLEAGNTKRIGVIVGYLTSPGGLNGEKVLVDWIKEKTGAHVFDLLTQRHQFRSEAADLMAEASMPDVT